MILITSETGGTIIFYGL